MVPSRKAKKTVPTLPSSRLVVVIDSREQRPYAFEHSITKPLPAGDYSVLGHETRIAIERKSHQDAYSSIGYGRVRFEREVAKLAQYNFGAIVIETSLPAFLIRPDFSRMRPQSAICTLLGWSVRYRIPVFFCGDREHARATTWHLLDKYSRYVREGRMGSDHAAQ